MRTAEPRMSGALLRDALVIVLCGVVTGLAFNWAQLAARPARGLPWIGSSVGPADQAILDSLTPRVSAKSGSALEHDAGAAGTPSKGAGTAGGSTAPLNHGSSSAPAAMAQVDSDEPGAASTDDLPSIPNVDHPLAVRLPLVSRFVQAGVALVVDARASSDFAAGHIPGAVSVPYEEATHDPTPLGLLRPGGRPIIVYCSGGDCDASRMLAEMMVRDFQLQHVLIYEGGYPEWVAAGLPVKEGGS